MGIRFACHVCGKKLNIKRELAGRRGVCPSCAAKIRIPMEDAETSTPVEWKAAAVAAVSAEPSAALEASSHGATDGNVAVAEPRVDSKEFAAVGEESNAGEFDSGREVASDFTQGLLDDDPSAVWYVRPPSGGQYGPASGDILKQWIAEGRVAKTALLWRDGWPQWRDAGGVLAELSDSLPSGDVSDVIAPAEMPPSKDSKLIHEGSSASEAAAGVTHLDAAGLTGESEVGASRRSRASQRILLIGVLAALVFALFGVLIVVANQ